LTLPANATSRAPGAASAEEQHSLTSASADASNSAVALSEFARGALNTSSGGMLRAPMEERREVDEFDVASAFQDIFADELKASMAALAAEREKDAMELLCFYTHAPGLVLAVAGSAFMVVWVRGRPKKQQASVAAYLFGLCFLFLASTIYHGLTSLRVTWSVVSALDRSAAYFLVVGSYTPFLVILFPDKPLYSEWILTFLWGVCVLGVGVAAILPDGAPRRIVPLCLHFNMGWVGMLMLRELSGVLSAAGLRLAVAGGLLYTAGVPFLFKDGQTAGVPDHVLWHLFLLAGAASHYLCILFYVVPAAAPTEASCAAASEAAADLKRVPPSSSAPPPVRAK